MQQWSSYLSSLSLNEPSMEQLGPAYRLLIVAQGLPGLIDSTFKGQDLWSWRHNPSAISQRSKSWLISSPLHDLPGCSSSHGRILSFFLPLASAWFLCFSSAVFVFGICPSGPQISWPDPCLAENGSGLSRSLSYILIRALWFFHCHTRRNIENFFFLFFYSVKLSAW